MSRTMAIMVPPPNTVGIPPPANPQIPPTFLDITHAKEYVEHLSHAKLSNAPNIPTDNEIGAAQRYSHEVTLANSLAGMAAPAWLGPFANNFNQLVANFDLLRGDIQQVLARQANDRIVRLNHAELMRNTGVTAYRAKQKEVAGDGTALANGLRPPGFAPLVALQVIPALGATIAPNINTSGLTHQTILQLVQFYNDHFGIQLGDMVPIRSQKIVNWLTTDI